MEREADLLVRGYGQQVPLYEMEIAQLETRLRDMTIETAWLSDLVDDLQVGRSTLVRHEFELRRRLDLPQWSSKHCKNTVIQAN